MLLLYANAKQNKIVQKLTKWPPKMNRSNKQTKMSKHPTIKSKAIQIQ